MATEEFKPGDVVELKSGSVPMTIERKARTDDDEWVCLWFDGATRREGHFPSDVLKNHEGSGTPRNISFSR